MRCIACDRALEDAPTVTCRACGGALHEECAAHGRCPTLRCGDGVSNGRQLVGSLAGAACLLLVGATMVRARASIEVMFVVVAVPTLMALVLGAVRLLDLDRSGRLRAAVGGFTGCLGLLAVACAPLVIVGLLHRAGQGNDAVTTIGIVASCALLILIIWRRAARARG